MPPKKGKNLKSETNSKPEKYPKQDGEEPGGRGAPEGAAGEVPGGGEAHEEREEFHVFTPDEIAALNAISQDQSLKSGIKNFDIPFKNMLICRTRNALSCIFG